MSIEGQWKNTAESKGQLSWSERLGAEMKGSGSDTAVWTPPPLTRQALGGPGCLGFSILFLYSPTLGCGPSCREDWGFVQRIRVTCPLHFPSLGISSVRAPTPRLPYQMGFGMGIKVWPQSSWKVGEKRFPLMWERGCPRRVLFSVASAECFSSPSFLGREVPVTSLSW